MTTHILNNENQTGRTTLLVNIAKGALLSKAKVVFFFPNRDALNRLALQYDLTDIVLKVFRPQWESLRETHNYDYILLDDCANMDVSEGSPVKLIEHSLQTFIKPITIIATE